MVPDARLRPRIGRIAAAAALALLAASAGAQEKPPSIARRVEDVLQSKGKDGERAARLENLGPDAVPILLDILGADTVPFATPDPAAVLVDDPKESLIVAALKRFERAELVPPIARSAPSSSSTRLRRAAVEALGTVGDRRDLSLLCRIATPGGPNDDLEPRLDAALRKATLDILRRDFGAYLALQDLLRGQFSATRLCLYRALADTFASQALAILVQRLGTEPIEDPLLLTEIARGSRFVPLPPEIGVREALRPYLHSDQTVLVQAATTSLGNLEDPDAVPDLIEQLRHADSFVRDCSHVALQKITGEKLLPDRDRWAAWYAGEREWYRERSRACIQDLRTEVEIRKHVAMAEFSKHPLYREEFTGHMLRTLPRESEGLQRLGICALGLMGSTSAVPYLEAMQTDANPELSGEARAALGRIFERRPQPEKQRPVGAASVLAGN
jgi:HEAT repeat protein